MHFGTLSAARRGLALSLCLWLASGCATLPDDTAFLPEPSLGLAIGDIGASSAVIWSRASGPATMHVTLDTAHHAPIVRQAAATAGNDFTGQVHVGGLDPATRYRVSVSFVDARGAALTRIMTGRFRTAPPAQQAAPVRFLFSGDLAGQNVCRDSERGFAIFSGLDRIEADFFIGLGDMIYADALCEDVGHYGNAQLRGEFGKATEPGDFLAHWRYNLADAGLIALRRRMGYVGVWDDHEVVNDFGPTSDRASPDGPHLMAPGLAAFLDYTPLAPTSSPTLLYRTLRWGAHAEFIILDTRQYRDDNNLRDTPAQPKTLLGQAQREWLTNAVIGSDATWKIIVSSVPLSIPTGWPPHDGRDGWASGDGDTGFEQELLTLLRAFRDAGVNNLLWLTTDVHFATGFAYRPFPETPGFVMHELVTGPMSAGLFAKPDVDETLHPTRLFFHGPVDFLEVTDYDEALGWMNVGLIDIGSDGELVFTLLDGHGESVAHRSLSPQQPSVISAD